MTLQEFQSEWHSPSPTLTLRTSGSTGQPKPIVVEKARMLHSARLTCNFLHLRPGHTALLCLPLRYIAGKMMAVRALERSLQLISVPPTGHPLAGFSATQPIDLCAMVPLQVHNSLQVPAERQALCRIRHLLVGGGAIHPDLETQLAQLPCTVWSTYGMTETLSHIALRRVNGPEASSWYSPFEGIGLSLDNRQCLCISAPMLCPNTLVTNDRAELRRSKGETLFRILGRCDNVVCSGGLKIQIEEVEALLAPHIAHPFLVSKAPCPELGEQLVLLAEDAHPHLLADLCRRILPQHWQPRHIMAVAHIPITATGKPARAQAQHMAQQMLQSPAAKAKKQR